MHVTRVSCENPIECSSSPTDVIMTIGFVCVISIKVPVRLDPARLGCSSLGRCLTLNFKQASCRRGKSPALGQGHGENLAYAGVRNFHKTIRV